MNWPALGEQVRKTMLFIGSDWRFWLMFLICVGLAAWIAWCRRGKGG